mgnify:CR=1 FL=1
MQERKLNMFAKQEEYMALRQYIRLVSDASGGALRGAINSELTKRQKQLIGMYYIEQMPMQDIADELGLHISSVSRTIKRGRERLKSALSYGGRNLLASLEDC